MLDDITKICMLIAFSIISAYAGIGLLYTYQLKGEIATGVGVIKAQEYLPTYDDLGEIPQKKNRKGHD